MAGSPDPYEVHAVKAKVIQNADNAGGDITNFVPGVVRNLGAIDLSPCDPVSTPSVHWYLYLVSSDVASLGGAGTLDETKYTCFN